MSVLLERDVPVAPFAESETPNIYNEMYMGAEIARNAGEYTRMLMSGELCRLWNEMPRGDGEAVVLLCGFMGNDSSVAAPLTYLAGLNYRVRSPGFGLHPFDNKGRKEDFNAAYQTVVHAAEDTGKKAKIVGHSLGGIYARAIAELRPDIVDTVVALGSPYNVTELNRLQRKDSQIPVERMAMRTMGWMFEDPLMVKVMERLNQPKAEVKYTSYFTQRDGVVRWRDCQDANSRCIEVEGASHSLLPFNPEVFKSLPFVLQGKELPKRIQNTSLHYVSNAV